MGVEPSRRVAQALRPLLAQLEKELECSGAREVATWLTAHGEAVQALWEEKAKHDKSDFDCDDEVEGKGAADFDVDSTESNGDAPAAGAPEAPVPVVVLEPPPVMLEVEAASPIQIGPTRGRGGLGRKAARPAAFLALPGLPGRDDGSSAFARLSNAQQRVSSTLLMGMGGAGEEAMPGCAPVTPLLPSTAPKLPRRRLRKMRPEPLGRKRSHAVSDARRESPAAPPAAPSTPVLTFVPPPLPGGRKGDRSAFDQKRASSAPRKSLPGETGRKFSDHVNKRQSGAAGPDGGRVSIDNMDILADVRPAAGQPSGAIEHADLEAAVVSFEAGDGWGSVGFTGDSVPLKKAVKMEGLGGAHEKDRKGGRKENPLLAPPVPMKRTNYSKTKVGEDAGDASPRNSLEGLALEGAGADGGAKPKRKKRRKVSIAFNPGFASFDPEGEGNAQLDNAPEDDDDDDDNGGGRRPSLAAAMMQRASLVAVSKFRRFTAVSSRKSSTIASEATASVEAAVVDTGSDKEGAVYASDEQVEVMAAHQRLVALDTYLTPLFYLYVVLQLVLVPLRCGLGMDITPISAGVDGALDLILLAEVATRFRRPIVVGGLLNHDRDAIAARYRGTTFFWDAVALLPVDFVAILVYQTAGFGMAGGALAPAWFRVNKLLVGRYAARLLGKTMGAGSNATAAARAATIMVVFASSIHFTACCFLAALRAEGDDDLYAFTQVEEMVTGSRHHRYMLLYDYSLKALVGMGRPGKIVPHTDWQTGFSIAVALAGVALYAVLLSAISDVVGTSVSTDEEWRHRREAVHDTLRYLGQHLNLPPAFITDVHAYFHHEYWVSRVLLGSPDDVFGTLPQRLSARINALVGQVVFSRVAFFKSVADDSAFVNYMLSRLTPRTYCRGEQVVTKGEEGDFMFLLMEGIAGVFDDASKKIVHVFGRGTALGEMALLRDVRRVTTVVALECCSCFLLTRKTFLEAEELFPDVVAAVRKAGEQQLNEMKVTELCEKLPILAEYKEDPVVRELLMGSVPEIHPAGTVVTRGGVKGDHLYFVSSGILVAGSQTLGEGDVFGGVSCLLNMTEFSSVEAVNTVTLFAVPKEVLLQKREESERCEELLEEIQMSAYEAFVTFIAEVLFEFSLKGDAAAPSTPATPATPLSPFSDEPAPPRRVSIDADTLPYYEQMSRCFFELHIAAGTCVMQYGQLVDVALVVVDGGLLETAALDGVGELRGPGTFVGVRCLEGAFYADSTLVAVEDTIAYGLSAGDLQAVADEFAQGKRDLTALYRMEILHVAFRAMYATTSDGRRRRCFQMWLSYMKVQQCQREWKYTAYQGSPVRMTRDSHLMLSQS